MNIWKKVYDYFNRQSREYRAHLLEIDKRNNALNQKVRTRQVLKRQCFALAMDDINRKVGGEPRRIRRAMARTLAWRWWKQDAGKRGVPA